MANLFPKIEVFTTIHHQWQTPGSIKHTPLKFAKELKVLDLGGFQDNTRFTNIFNAILDKLETDGVVRIRQVSFPTRSQLYDTRQTKAGFSEAECVAKILSRVTVDHLVLHTTSLTGMYTICAQIHDMHVQSPINVYFTGIYFCSNYTRPFRADQSQLRLGFYDTYVTMNEGQLCGTANLCLKLKIMGVGEPEGVQITGDTFKMITVHFNGLYSPSYELEDSEIRLSESQGLSLEDFPHIEVNPHWHFDTNLLYTADPEAGKHICNDLGITTNDEWPIWPIYKDAKDTKSVCFDSRIDGYRLVKATDPNHLLNLSESLNKISPHAGPHPTVTVAVLDTGILACHREFKDKIVAMKNFVPNEAIDLCYDANGHGTSCAGILVRTAPFVRLVICKVMSSQGHGQPKLAADAIDWLLNDESGPKNYCPVDIISMSFGWNSFDSNLRRAVSDAIVGGKVVVAAASNDGRRNVTNIAFPARFGDVICVGSCNNLGQPSSFSPTGREIDFLAPGEAIEAPSCHGCDQYQRMSGTSEATPTVAGIAAMVISRAEAIGGQGMRCAVGHTAVMREILRKMASMPGHHDEHMGYGNLDPWRLLKYGPDHFRQVVEEIVGPLPVSQQFAVAQSNPPVNKRGRQRRASDSDIELKRGGERQ